MGTPESIIRAKWERTQREFCRAMRWPDNRAIPWADVRVEMMRKAAELGPKTKDPQS